MSEEQPPPPPGLRQLFAWAATAESRFLLWKPPPGPAGRPLHAAQAVGLALRRYRQDHAGDRAAALAFSTLLWLIPILLMGLSFLGKAGVSAGELAALRRWMLENTVPETAREIEGLLNATLASLADLSQGLGLLGLVAFLFAAWKFLATLDRTFQMIAGNSTVASRLRRLGGFWIAGVSALVLVAVSLVASGIVETLSARGLLPGNVLPGILRWLVPFLPVVLALVLAYRFCAGTRIAWRSAVLGAVLTASSLEILKAGFAAYLRHALVARTLLAGMGVIPLFLLWIYLSWALFLAGAEMTLAADDYRATLKRSGLA